MNDHPINRGISLRELDRLWLDAGGTIRRVGTSSELRYVSTDGQESHAYRSQRIDAPLKLIMFVRKWAPIGPIELPARAALPRSQDRDVLDTVPGNDVSSPDETLPNPRASSHSRMRRIPMKRVQAESVQHCLDAIATFAPNGTWYVFWRPDQGIKAPAYFAQRDRKAGDANCGLITEIEF